MKKTVLMSLVFVVLIVIVFGVIKIYGGKAAPEATVKVSSQITTFQAVADKTVNPTSSASLAAPKSSIAVKSDEDDENDGSALKAMRDQISKERDIQQQIKLHNLELERTKVQLEQEKALAEMSQLRKTNLGIVRDSNGNGTLSLPDTKLVFLTSSEKATEAILSINGTNYTVKEGDKPWENLLVRKIGSKGVTLVLNGDKEILLTPNMME